jgi:hypothetical protein
MMFKANVTASLTTESRSWITERRPPAKFAHGNYRRADWFEYRFGQLLALCDEAFLWNSPAEFDEWKARVDALAQGKLL